MASFRSEIESQRYPMDPSSVVVSGDFQEGEDPEEEGLKDDSRTPAATSGTSSGGASRVLVEAKRTKGAKTFQVRGRQAGGPGSHSPRHAS